MKKWSDIRRKPEAKLEGKDDYVNTPCPSRSPVTKKLCYLKRLHEGEHRSADGLTRWGYGGFAENRERIPSTIEQQYEDEDRSYTVCRVRVLKKPCLKPRGHEGAHDPDWSEERPQTSLPPSFGVVNEFNKYKAPEENKIEDKPDPFLVLRRYLEGVPTKDEASQALKDLMEQQRKLFAKFNEAEVKIIRLTGQVEDLKEELKTLEVHNDAHCQELQECNAKLHNQKQHELGNKCGELQSVLDSLKVYIRQSPDIPPMVKNQMNQIANFFDGSPTTRTDND